MGLIAIFILFFLIADVIVEAVSAYLNTSVMKDRIPEPFKGVYDADAYKKAQQYLKTTTIFGQVSSFVDLFVVLAFWFLKGFFITDEWVRGFSYGPVVSGILFIGVLLFLKTMISLPFGLYATFVIEERFGFNKTTWGTWIKDRIKGFLLSIGLGVPLLALVLWFFETSGAYAWIWCWMAVTGFTLFVQFIAPTWIMPLFNKFTPLEESDLKTAIVNYAKSIDFSLDNIFMMDGSKRSAKSNAFFTGFGKNKRIVLFDTLIEKHTTDELVSILAHEMGHYKKKHILKMFMAGFIQTGMVFFLMSFIISYQGLFDAFYVKQPSVYAGLVFFGMLYFPVDFFLNLFSHALSRRHEYEADGFAVQTTGGKTPMINALKKLSVHNLSNLFPHPFHVFLHYSHPPVLKRIDAIEKI